MKTVTVSYPIVMSVQNPDNPRGGLMPDTERYEGFNGKTVESVDVFMDAVIERMTDIYGNLPAMYYVPYQVDRENDEVIHVHLHAVITAIAESSHHSEELIEDALPTDLNESFKECWKDSPDVRLLGYDLNLIDEGPDLNTANYW